jgi:hypothetical protein
MWLRRNRLVGAINIYGRSDHHQQKLLNFSNIQVYVNIKEYIYNQFIFCYWLFCAKSVSPPNFSIGVTVKNKFLKSKHAHKKAFFCSAVTDKCFILLSSCPHYRKMCAHFECNISLQAIPKREPLDAHVNQSFRRMLFRCVLVWFYVFFLGGGWVKMLTIQNRWEWDRQNPHWASLSSSKACKLTDGAHQGQHSKEIYPNAIILQFCE